MLSILRISNLAIVDELEIEFSPGLNVLTGETGAGKSVVLKAIEILIGKRAGADVIRSCAEKCEVEGLFLLSPEILILLRERLDEIDEILAEDELLLKP